MQPPPGSPVPPPPPPLPPLLVFCKVCSWEPGTWPAARIMWEQFYIDKVGATGGKGTANDFKLNTCDFCSLRHRREPLTDFISEKMKTFIDEQGQRGSSKVPTVADIAAHKNAEVQEHASAHMWNSSLRITPLSLPKEMKGYELSSFWTLLTSYCRTPVQTAVGAQHFMYLTDVGEVWSWGENSYANLNQTGKLGHGGGRKPSAVPLLVEAFKSKNITQVACGEHHSAAVDDAANGRLGHGPAIQAAYEPFAVEALKRKRISSVQCGARHTLFLSVEGEVYGCGMGAFGASGHLADMNEPTLVSLPHPVSTLSCGLSHTLALTSNGLVFAWGLSSHNRLGAQGLTQKDYPHERPVQVNLGNARIVQIAAGSQFSLALTSEGQVWAWGKNDRGQLGIGVTTSDAMPTLVKNLPFNVFRITAAVNHAAALTDTGEVFQWGQGTVRTHLYPNDILHFCKLVVDHVCFESAAMRLNTPVKLPVPEFVSFQQVAAGGESTIGLTGFLRSLLGEELGSLLTSAEFSDITICLPRGQRIPAHKVILHARCAPLVEELASDATEVSLETTDAAARALLLYLYSDRIDKLDPDTRSELSALAVKFKLNRLAGICGKSVVKAAATLKEDLLKALKLHLHADLQLISEDTPFPAHRAILSARCKYFSAMFHSNMKEASQEELPIPDFERPTVSALLHFLYSDELAAEPTVAVDLLAMANQYTLPRLKHLCVGVIEKGVDDETICYVYQAARLYEVPALISFCKGYIAEHWADVKKHESFANLTTEEIADVTPPPPALKFAANITTAAKPASPKKHPKGEKASSRPSAHNTGSSHAPKKAAGKRDEKSKKKSGWWD